MFGLVIDWNYQLVSLTHISQTTEQFFSPNACLLPNGLERSRRNILFYSSDNKIFTVQVIETQLLENQPLDKFLKDKRLKWFVRKPPALQPVRTSEFLRESRETFSRPEAGETSQPLLNSQGQRKAKQVHDQEKLLHTLKSGRRLYAWWSVCNFPQR